MLIIFFYLLGFVAHDVSKYDVSKWYLYFVILNHKFLILSLWNTNQYPVRSVFPAYHYIIRTKQIVKVTRYLTVDY